MSPYVCIPVVSGPSGTTPLLNSQQFQAAGFPVLAKVSGLLYTSGLQCIVLIL